MYLLIIYLPLFNFLINIIYGRFLLPKGTAFISIFSILISFLISLFCFFEVGFCKSVVCFKLFFWIDLELLDSNWGFLYDSVTVTMSIVVTFISLLVHFYSTSYMSHDPHQIRFMSLLSVFTFFMLVLITSDNFVQLFFGWEGVGVCSYLLINFWFTRLQANKSAIKAMIVNRIGDFGLVLGIFLVYSIFKTIDFLVIFSLIPYYFLQTFNVFDYSLNLVSIISLLLFIGSIGKSAQLGLHTWLPDAMEGPTPVSALIHAATMVTAGVFLIIRASPIFEFSQYVLNIIVIFGSLTAFFAGSVSIFQNDLKKIIAYSTCSQLGYMIFICGLSNYSASLFHVVNHAFFKALLFLSAGSIIHSLFDEQDLRKMGGLLKILPFTYIMVLIGSFALMGFPFLTGFYSKDFILELCYSKYSFIGMFAFWFGLFSAILTSFYSFKLIYLAFLNSPNNFKNFLQLSQDASFGLAFPLFLLSVASIFVGFIAKDLFVGLGTPFFDNSIFILFNHSNLIDVEFIPLNVKLLPFFLSIYSVVLSLLVYYFHTFIFNVHIFDNFYIQLVYKFFNKKWFFDKLQNQFFVFFLLKFGYKISYAIIDKGIIELICLMYFTNLLIYFSKYVNYIQSGLTNQYAFLFFTSVFILFIFNIIFFFYDLFIDKSGFLILSLFLVLFY